MLTRRTMIASLAALPVVAAEDEWKPMFDGTTLNGWSVREGPATAFHVADGAIVIHPGSNFPAWLRFDKVLENFEFRCEFFVKNWANGGIYLHAPEHGRSTWTGLKINLFQKQEQTPLPESVGSIFPIVPPLNVNVRNKGEWNTLRTRFDWPSLRVWINDEVVQDLNVESIPELRHRLRSGYIGIESLSYPLRFRNLQYRELPSKERWQVLYAGADDFDRNWRVAEGKATWEPLGPVLRADGLGYLATKELYKDFEFQCYIRGSKHHNGGIIFRQAKPSEKILSSEHYEIQLHDVEGAVYPTGSLYGYKRAAYPRIEPERWFPFQLIAQGDHCIVRVNGDTIVDYKGIGMQEAPIMLQAHQNNRWIEYKQIRVKRL